MNLLYNYMVLSRNAHVASKFGRYFTLYILYAIDEYLRKDGEHQWAIWSKLIRNFCPLKSTNHYVWPFKGKSRTETRATWSSLCLHHDDVIKWKHFPRYWPFVRGIHRSPVNSLHKGQWRGAFMFSLICAWIYLWVNNCEAGDLRR